MGTLPKTELGDGLTVSAIGFGGMALTPVYGAVDDTESLATLNHCLDVGMTFIDTANVYGGGANERLIGQVLAGRRDEVTLATKFGIDGDPTTGKLAARGDAEYVRRCVDEPGPARHRRDRLVLHAPSRRVAADRGDRRRHGRVGHGGQGAPPRAVGGDR